jgi:NAD(P)-dependent dehydrogenase (short-subunit alcohol dehydrogenase family)
VNDALLDRIALVTGAGRGIGRVIALALSDAGAAVALSGRSAEALEETRGLIAERGDRPALVVPADVTDEHQVRRMAERVRSELGEVDVLVANSGVGGPSVPLWEVDLAEWEATMAVNVTGVFLSCRAVLPEMLRRRSGSVVVIGSLSGKRPLVNRTPYTASKTALIGLVRTLATEVGPYGVRVNLVSPGGVEGERIEWAIREQARARGISLEQARETFTADSPMQRLVPPEDVAEAVVFLASDRARSVTGEDLNVSAGAVMY